MNCVLYNKSRLLLCLLQPLNTERNIARKCVFLQMIKLMQFGLGKGIQMCIILVRVLSKMGSATAVCVQQIFNLVIPLGSVC